MSCENIPSDRAILSRRAALGVGTGLLLSPALQAFAADTKPIYKIGACDWSIGRAGRVDALELAKEIGLDGVQVSFGAPGGQYDLREFEARRQYLEASKRHSVEIASLAMGVLNSRPYASDPDAERWVQECVEIMPLLWQRVVLLAFFGAGDIKDSPAAQREVVRRLKRVAPAAEKAGVILGIESWLGADDHMRILDAVGSPAVQVYYDTANMHKQGYDIYKEIRQLGAGRICEIHTKENIHLLGKGPVDFSKVKEALDEIGYRGWLIIESAVDRARGTKESYQHNQRYLRSVFPTLS